MRIEVLCTGDELLTGVIADTNSPFFMARLLRLGERVLRTTVVGDERAAISGALRELAGRADVVLVSGGLGPTADDLTAAAAADAAGVALVEDEGTLERIPARLAQRGLPLSPNNARQALVPQGAEVVPNPVGSAPMFALRIGRAQCFFLPGVPREYQALVEREVLPRIRALRPPAAAAHAFRILRTVGLPESQLDARVAPLRPAHPDVVFGFRTVLPENHLELLASGPTQQDADAALAAAEQDAVSALGEYFFGRDEETLALAVVHALQTRGESVSFAESCTGGLLAGALTSVSGASEVFPGGAVTYDARVKTDLAGVEPGLIAAKGVVSAEVAEAMARGVRARLGTTWAVSVTGYAGPGGGDAREPVGAVYIGVDGPDGTTHVRHLFQGGRERVRQFAVGMALDALRRRLQRLRQQGTT